ncbi:hypothetical protein RchiOBHm_Chr7g0228841 [Rosa chinensis]|uniref:Uncharacterized protein n=1 Tax=Rosa chinensis TaxID=74649 RepID=A0A2P6PF14_ROSCH|nr:hypothetical protein RchiOBHm_Chr7g0228841 [Rosa chinensis]
MRELALITDGEGVLSFGVWPCVTDLGTRVLADKRFPSLFLSLKEGRE